VMKPNLLRVLVWRLMVEEVSDLSDSGFMHGARMSCLPSSINKIVKSQKQ
jgi:hypothetical protein